MCESFDAASLIAFFWRAAPRSIAFGADWRPGARFGRREVLLLEADWRPGVRFGRRELLLSGQTGDKFPKERLPYAE